MIWCWSLEHISGVKVEGILRQAADVDDVEHRIREYKQGLFLLQFVLSMSYFGILFTLFHGAKFFHRKNLTCFAKTMWTSVLRNGSVDMYLKLFPVPKIHTSCELLNIIVVRTENTVMFFFSWYVNISNLKLKHNES